MVQRRGRPDPSVLMNEYSACQSSVESLDSSVWQSAAIIGLASVGTFALIAANNPQVLAVIIVGFFSTLGSFAWWRLANRWWSVRDAKIARMRHIEDDLQIAGQSHYIDFMNDLHLGRSSMPIPAADHLIRGLAKRHNIRIERASELAGLEYERKGPKDVLRWFPWVTMIVWVAYVALRTISVLVELVTPKWFMLPIWGWWNFDA